MPTTWGGEHCSQNTIPLFFSFALPCWSISQVLQAATKPQVDFYFKQGRIWLHMKTARKLVQLSSQQLVTLIPADPMTRSQVFLEYFFDAEDRRSTFSLRVSQTRGCVLPGFLCFKLFEIKTKILLKLLINCKQVSPGMEPDCPAATIPETNSFVPSAARWQSLLLDFTALLCFVQLFLS